MTERFEHRMTALILLYSIFFNIAAYGQTKQKLGEQAVARIEQFRRSNGRLPNSLAEAGSPDSEHGQVFYCIRTDNDYFISYESEPGQGHTYDSKIKTWSDTKGGLCLAPSTRQEQEAMQALEEQASCR